MILSLLQKSSVGKLPRKLLYPIKTYSAEGLGEKRSFRTMSVNYITEFMDKKAYPVFSSTMDSKFENSNYPMKIKPITSNMLFSQEKRDEFMSYFPDIVNQLEEKGATLDCIDHGRHFRKVLEYFIPNGRQYGGVVTAETYKMLIPKSAHTPENIKLAYYLGWCVELSYDSIFMSDDLMDGAELRRNRICWHRLEDVQLKAINDAHLIDAGLYYLLRKHFGHLDCFMRLLACFNDISFMYRLGQQIEMTNSNDAFNTSLELYRMAVQCSSVYMASYLPVVAGMTLAGYTDQNEIKKAQTILTQLGYFYLIENDYMDCFGDQKLIGKVGRDIQTGRCRWPIVAFMEIATPQQKKLMRVHYGQDNEESVAIAKQLFEEVNIHQIYANYTAELHHNLMREIEENSYGDLKQVYEKLVETITCSTKAGGVFI